jgi:hypothetical protein
MLFIDFDYTNLELVFKFWYIGLEVAISKACRRSIVRSVNNRWNLAFLSLVLVASCLLSGCAPLLIAGGAVGGYAIAKDMQDGQLIDSKKKA